MLLIVNVKIEDSWTYWQGKFRDLTPLWYQNVGTTLLTTMIINVITVPAIVLGENIARKIKRCLDRGCGCSEKSTRKKLQKDYEELYMGPEFLIDFRYSQILALVFVCFLYSGGMPFLYITSFAQLLLTYYFDKTFLLKICRLPKNYDEKLESIIRTTLYVIVVVHLLFTIFMYGNSDIFNQTVSVFTSFTTSVNTITSNISNASSGVVTKFFKRIILDHNLVLFIILVIILVIIILKGFLLSFLRRTIFSAFFKEEEVTKIKAGKSGGKSSAIPNYSFYYVVKSEDLAQLIKLTKVTIKTTKNQGLIGILHKKLDILKQEYQLKKQEEDAHVVDANVKFIGSHTYDIRLNETYKAQFAIEEQLDDEHLH